MRTMGSSARPMARVFSASRWTPSIGVAPETAAASEEAAAHFVRHVAIRRSRASSTVRSRRQKRLHNRCSQSRAPAEGRRSGFPASHIQRPGMMPNKLNRRAMPFAAHALWTTDEGFRSFVPSIRITRSIGDAYEAASAGCAAPLRSQLPMIFIGRGARPAFRDHAKRHDRALLEEPRASGFMGVTTQVFRIVAQVRLSRRRGWFSCPGHFAFMDPSNLRSRAASRSSKSPMTNLDIRLSAESALRKFFCPSSSLSRDAFRHP